MAEDCPGWKLASHCTIRHGSRSCLLPVLDPYPCQCLRFELPAGDVDEEKPSLLQEFVGAL